MVQEKLQELELPRCEHSLLPLVAQHTTIRVKPEALEFPDPLVPQVKPAVIPLHLGFDEGHVLDGGHLRHRRQLRQLPSYSFEQTKFEADQVIVDADPMERVVRV